MGKLCPHVEFHPGIVSLSLSLHSSFFLPELSIFLSSAFLLSLALPFLKRLEICRRMGEFDSNDFDFCRGNARNEKFTGVEDLSVRSTIVDRCGVCFPRG